MTSVIRDEEGRRRGMNADMNGRNVLQLIRSAERDARIAAILSILAAVFCVLGIVGRVVSP